MTPLTKMRLVKIAANAAIVGFAVLALVHLASAFGGLLGVVLTIELFGQNIFSGTDQLSASSQVIYHFAGAAVCLLFIAISVIVYRMTRSANGGTQSYQANARKLVAVSMLLVGAEAIRGAVKVLVLGRDISVSNIASYAAIFCLLILSMIMHRAVSTRRYYDGSI